MKHLTNSEEEYDIKNLKASEVGGLPRDPNELSNDAVLKESSLRELGDDARSFALTILERARDYWYDLQDFRDRRERNRDFVLGQQWNDTIPDPDNSGSDITEEAYLLRQGKIPMINNQLGQLIKNLMGQFRNNDYKPQVKARRKEDASVTEMITNALQGIYDVNELTEVDAHTFYEFLISGMFLQKSGYDWIRQRNENDVVTDRTQTTRICFNTDVSDIRMKDMRFICEIVDTDVESIVTAFAENKDEEEIIRHWYSHVDTEGSTQLVGFDEVRDDSMDFYFPYDNSQARYFEIWMLKKKTKVIVHDTMKGEQFQHPASTVEEALAQVEAENDARLEEGAALGLSPEELMDIPLMETDVVNEDVWCYYILTANGYILDSGETPYEHEEHPYTIRLHPMIDRVIRAFVEDVIDQQKHINRLITLMDFMISASAKGLLMIPEDSIPAGWTPDQFADQWRRSNGYIVYKPSTKHTKAPEQVTSNAQSVGAQQLLMLQMELFNKISGVTEAIQGQTPASGTPASLYAQQANNATLSTKDHFEFFFNARKHRDYKNVKLLQQFYDEERYVNTSGQDYAEEAHLYDPNVAKDVPVEVIISKSGNSPVYQDLINEHLKEFLMAGMIDFPTYLESSSVPYADKLLQRIKEKSEEAQAQLSELQASGGGMGTADPQLQQQVLQGLLPMGPN